MFERLRIAPDGTGFVQAILQGRRDNTVPPVTRVRSVASDDLAHSGSPARGLGRLHVAGARQPTAS
jgi:hypothetical protein